MENGILFIFVTIGGATDMFEIVLILHKLDDRHYNS